MALENFDYTATLEYDTKTKMYDLFIVSFNGNIIRQNYRFFFCTRRHNARLDLVSIDIYNTSKWSGTLGQLNDIMHNFQIRDGDIIAYLPESDMSSLGDVPNIIKQTSQLANKVKSDLINILKKKKPDPNRKIFKNNRRQEDALPPTILADNSPQIVVENNKIRITPNLFTSPKSTPTEVIETENKTNISDIEVERILVRKYIKLANS